MLKNENSGVLKNGDAIFKSQVVDSYLRVNTAFNNYVKLTTTGLTTSQPLSVYYQTPTDVLKRTYTTDLNNYNINFGSTYETSYKNWYFCGNLEAVESSCFFTSSTDGCWNGDLAGYANQFPNLTCLDTGSREVNFNQDLTYTIFPENLTYFKIFDRGIQGDVATIGNWENIECWCLCCTQSLTGNFHDIKFNNNLKCTDFWYLPTSISVDINTLVDKNTGYTHSSFYFVDGSSMCADTLDVSNLEYIRWYTPYSKGMKGDVSDWCFNTGLTCLCLATCCAYGNIENWNIDETRIISFALYNRDRLNYAFSGDLSTWQFPETLQYFNLNYTEGITAIPTDYSNTNLYQFNISQTIPLSGDVTTFNFGNNLSQLSIYQTSMFGNLENLVLPSGVTNPQLRYSNFTGNVTGITFNTGTTYIYLDYNDLTGNVAAMQLPTSTYGLLVNGNPQLYFDSNTPFDTGNMQQMNLGNIDCIYGSLSNLTVGDNLLYLCLNETNVQSDLNELDLNNIQQLTLARSCLAQDITPMFTGATNMCYFCACYNPDLSGDTTNWQADNIYGFCVNCTSLCGRLKIACPYQLGIVETFISSCIDTDFDFSNQGYNICMSNSCIQGNLSNVTLPFGIYRFDVSWNPNIYGSDNFTDQIFVNRKNFTRSYIILYWNNIGDTVSGVAEVSGDTGTYYADNPGNNLFDLTEAEVNNLVDGNDWDGTGTNTPWDNKNKIWWIKNALVSSSSPTRRYNSFVFQYS